MDQNTLGGVLCASVPVAGIVLAAWLVVRWSRRRREARTGKRVEPRRKTAAWAWVGLFTLVGLMAWISITSPRREIPLPPPPPDPPRPAAYWLWVAVAGVVAALLAGGSVLFTFLTRLGRKSRGVVVMAVMLAFGASIVVIPTTLGPSPALMLAIIAGLTVGFAGGFYWLMALVRDREVWKIIERAEETGDLDEAVAELRAVIDAKGPSIHRSDGLGHLLMKQGAWGEAYRTFLELETLAGRKPYILNNQAVSLIELGRAAEALPLLEEAMREEPKDIVFSCNYGLALAALDRRDEARGQLLLAEQERAKLGRSYPKALLDGLDELIGRLRRRVGPAEGMDKKDMTGWDEL